MCQTMSGPRKTGPATCNLRHGFQPRASADAHTTCHGMLGLCKPLRLVSSEEGPLLAVCMMHSPRASAHARRSFLWWHKQEMFVTGEEWLRDIQLLSCCRAAPCGLMSRTFNEPVSGHPSSCRPSRRDRRPMVGSTSSMPARRSV